ncbi:nucleoside diphosphate-linked moiety X motif 17 isoform X1 [Crotalus tigris]|uniref:nucleoside diphosphate-linked moiety X motif 17 isoform X1 n=1 Tax=Crotalus tigris TaxID=88082 RepID=UPI00192F9BBA|nr:nucleoside diphosphate-linked moiety X motif 17 isoform X1 [Crotalus tigris]
MLAGRRVAVHVCRGGGFPQRARFEQSIVGHCCPPHEDSGIVHCALKPLQFLVSDQEFPGSTRLLLKRPPFCPIKHLTVEQRASLPTESRCQGVDVGVAVLLESANQKILLTRRARTLSLFPTAWVPPGGHIELEEELLDAGLRELEEETGLQLQDGEFSWHLLALWESVYPPQLSQGLPQRHHIVIYLHLALHESHQQLQIDPHLSIGQAEAQRSRGQRCRLAGPPHPGIHCGYGGRGRRRDPRGGQGGTAHCQHRGTGEGLNQDPGNPHRHLPGHSTRGGRGASQHRYQVRPPAVAELVSPLNGRGCSNTWKAGGCPGQPSRVQLMHLELPGRCLAPTLLGFCFGEWGACVPAIAQLPKDDESYLAFACLWGLHYRYSPRLNNSSFSDRSKLQRHWKK